MATLSGQTIQSTYQGLLKLATSTTGITSTLQSVEDGLGNSLQMKVSTGRTFLPYTLQSSNYKPRYAGPGFTNSSAQQFAAGTQNIILAQPFFDLGLYDYSAITYNVFTATTISDLVEVAFYNTQVGASGHTPYQRIGAVQTLSGLTTTGVKTLDITGGTISFSAGGSDVYWLVFKINNSGATPVVRFGSQPNTLVSNIVSNSLLGIAYTQPLTNTASSFYRSNGTFAAYTGTTTFDATYTYSTLIGTQSTSTTSINGFAPGFIFHINNF